MPGSARSSPEVAGGYRGSGSSMGTAESLPSASGSLVSSDELPRLRHAGNYGGEDLPPARKMKTGASMRSELELLPSMDRMISREVTRRRERSFSSSLPRLAPDIHLPPPLPPRDEYEVQFEGPDDPLLPYNWPIRKKAFQVFMYIVPNLMVAFMSSIYGPALPFVEEEFHLGVTPAALGISLFIFGFAVGPILWGPLSEVYGRKPPYIVGHIAFTCCCFAAATAPNTQTLMLSRFFGGTFGAAAVVLVPSTVSDQFSAKTRGQAMTCFTMAVITGPLVSPIVGAFITYSYLGWRWTQYIIAIPSCAVLIPFVLFAKESYRPVILVGKAEELRQRTGIWGIHAPQEDVSFDFREVCERNVVRPIKMLFTEPVLLIISVYIGYIYGIQYLCLECFPIIFTGYENAGRGFHKGVKYLPYVGLLVGTIVAGMLNLLYFEPRFVKLLKKNDVATLPEARLVPMMAGAIAFPIGIFWLCWSGAYPEHVHWIVPCIGAAFVMFGIFQAFLQSVNYVTDVYINFAASANAAMAFLRAAMAAAFPLFGSQMFNNLGTQWAGTLLGCLGAVAIPFPFIFYKYGKTLRARSAHAYKGDI